MLDNKINMFATYMQPTEYVDIGKNGIISFKEAKIFPYMIAINIITRMFPAAAPLPPFFQSKSMASFEEEDMVGDI